ncbi:MAG: hypothetical protein ACK2UO_02265, partial [Caldilineaceae bacterium]
KSQSCWSSSGLAAYSRSPIIACLTRHEAAYTLSPTTTRSFDNKKTANRLSAAPVIPQCCLGSELADPTHLVAPTYLQFYATEEIIRPPKANVNIGNFFT